MNLKSCEHIADLGRLVSALGSQRSRPRVLFLSYHLLGMATYARELEALTADEDRFDSVHVRVTTPRLIRYLGMRVVPAKRLDTQAWRYIWLWQQMIRRQAQALHLEHCFDAVHVLAPHMGMGLLDVKGLGSLPMVVNVDSTSKADIACFGYGAWARKRIIAAEKRLYERADRVATWSQWAADSVHGDYGIPKQKIIVARPWLRAIPTQKTTVEHPNQQDSKDILELGFVGNAYRRKGGDRLLRWHQSRWRTRIRLHYFSSGVPKSAGSLPGVVVHGRIARDELIHHWLPRLDGVVIPTHEDTALIAAIEAQLAGVPVVTSRIAGVAESVLHGQSGMVCEPEDDDAFIEAIETLLHNSELRVAMGKAAQAFARERFVVPAAGKPLLNTIAGLVATSQSHG